MNPTTNQPDHNPTNSRRAQKASPYVHYRQDVEKPSLGDCHAGAMPGYGRIMFRSASNHLLFSYFVRILGLFTVQPRDS